MCQTRHAAPFWSKSERPVQSTRRLRALLSRKQQHSAAQESRQDVRGAQELSPGHALAPEGDRCVAGSW